ncbi:aminopeptidase P family protein [Salinarimonas ramus]|uniref:Aminopeptidase n=1 Tax=Salinarimonas ramus TaxID=690164 RepID=A0A917Q893_9HYPH|nr:aminopeptidase P family protein [Salinarimonas ramus]GGK35112.1 aminopeptidase [Salinarimonas ramus]
MSRFQTFDDRADPARTAPRIAALRAELARRGVQGFVVPRSDEHQSEYVPPCDERLAWLTGFTGSAGTAVILADRAALFVDGRYTLQAPSQTDTGVITVVNSGETSPARWVEANLAEGAALAYDPWLHTAGEVARLEAAAKAAGGRLVALSPNPIDAIWEDRPARPKAPVRPHPEELAGLSRSEKLARLRETLAAEKLDALVVSDPHALAWLFNLRGGDVAHTPLPLGYALLPREGTATLFLDPAKVTNETGDAVGALATFRAPDALAPALADLAARGGKIRLDRDTAAKALSDVVREAGAEPDVGADPIARMKAVKTPAEIDGARAAHVRDGAAFARFLAWFEDHAPGGLTEIDVVERLEAYRAETGALEDVSFPTIAGAGPNGAIVHYRVTAASNRALATGELFLIDSGAQYRDGTTDITRTLPVGEPTDEMRDRYTRVLKGHLAISRAVFPKGATGAQIDGFARAPLWQAGLDYDHGTGHGVGSFLSVHEGPQRIAKTGTTPLEPGMILSNEPGYYKTGAYGIRIENLILVEAREIAGGEREMRGFETLTLAPYARALIAPALLDADEIAFVDAYHARVLETLGPLVDEATRDWLAGACAPL